MLNKLKDPEYSVLVGIGSQICPLGHIFSKPHQVSVLCHALLGVFPLADSVEVLEDLYLYIKAKPSHYLGTITIHILEILS